MGDNIDTVHDVDVLDVGADRPRSQNALNVFGRPPEVTRTDLEIHKSNANVIQLTIKCLTFVLSIVLLCTAAIVVWAPNGSPELWKEIAPLVVQGIVPLAAAALGHFFTKK